MPDKLVVKVDREIAGLVPRFLANRSVDVEKIRAALARSDFEAIRATGHGLKGVGTGYGFPDISRLGAAIEEAARRHDPDAIALLAADLDGYLARLDVRYP
jgi:HPt (histidine-containing phosphotransfer) domain-containing protein